MTLKQNSRRIQRFQKKVTKPVGRFVARPQGQALLLGALAIAGIVAASRNPRVRTMVANLADRMKRVGGERIDAAREAIMPMLAKLGEAPQRGNSAAMH